MSRGYCQRHQHQRPCPKCGQAGYGGAGRGQGRKPELEQPVRVLVNLEQAELDAVLEQFPGMSRSAALRQTIQRGLREPSTTPKPPDPPTIAVEADNLIHETRIREADRTVELTYDQFHLVRKKVLYWYTMGSASEVGLDVDETVYKALAKLLTQQALGDAPRLAVVPKGKKLDDPCLFRLSLPECRRLRGAINGFLKAARKRIEAERKGYRARQKKRREDAWITGKQTETVSEEVYLKRVRKEHRALHPQLRRILEKIPWR